jgi:NADP-dependent 3-hydroxy acid dehydrogenase YdfG
MQDLKGKVAWVTGAGTGIGEAGALALAREGAIVLLTGRRREPLDAVTARIEAEGGTALARPADMSKAAAVQKVVDGIRAEQDRLDILVNNAGINIPNRSWQQLKAEGIDTIIQGNLTSAFYVVQAVLPMMRAQGGGVMIHTSSWAGRWPNEVATPILVNRPVPETPEAMARMIQPEDMGNLIAYVARQPPHICINEVLISPTHNRGYISTMKARQAQIEAGSRK